MENQPWYQAGVHRLLAIPLSRRCLIGGALFGISLVGFGLFSVYPNAMRYHRLKGELAVLHRQQTATARLAQRLARLHRQIDARQQGLQVAVKTFFEGDPIEALLAALSRCGDQAGVDLVGFEPQAQVMGKRYVEVPVKVQMRGRYHAFAAFFKALAALPQIVTLKTLDVITVEPVPELSICFTVISYRLIDTQIGPDERRSAKG